MGDNSSFWRTVGRISVIVTIVAGLVTILGYFIHTQQSANGIGMSVTTGSGTKSSVLTPLSTFTPAATSTALPKPGTVLCRSGANDNWAGWPAGGQWHILNNLLLNDGSDTSEEDLSLVPPAACNPPTPNYAIEAVIQCTGCTSSNSFFEFGLAARYDSSSGNGYFARVWGYHTSLTVAGGGEFTSGGITFNPGSGYHTYRLAVVGNSVTFSIDGAIIDSGTDNTALSTGQCGLWSYQTQLQISSFKVTAL